VWTVSADALFLNRSRLPSQNLLIIGLAPSLLNANDFDLPVQLGWQIDVTRRLCDDWSLDARYFNLGGQSDSISTTFEDSANLLVAQQPYFTNLAIYTSRLQSVELNACRSLNDWLTVLAGIRYLNLDDRILVYEFAPGDFDGIFQLAGFNDLLGFQIGADAHLLQQGPFSVNMFLKAGIYDDLARNAFAYDSIALADHYVNGASANNLAFCGELGITLTYDLTERLSIRGGYQLLWLDGVALASQQPLYGPTGPLDGQVATGTNGDLFYNGAFAGLEYRF
jgi:hypothetical protein